MSLVKPRLCLAIETSCDDTSVAVVEETGFVRLQKSADQNKMHEPFGGVVPEVASRNHTQNILPLVDNIFSELNITANEIDCLAVTNRPGLIGSLLVGLVTAKSLALTWNKPFVGVNHLEGHILAPWLTDDKHAAPDIQDSLPALVLAVSGGHTQLYYFSEIGKYEILGASIDDAAGEALDKFAKELGLGFPGGALLDRWARKGDPNKFTFSMGLQHKGLDFSFSGTKASAMRLLQGMSAEEIENSIYDLCASFEKNVIDILILKLERALQDNKNVRTIAITGGVSANTYLRECSTKLALKYQKQVLVPPLRYCTDNAAMIGYAGLFKFLSGQSDDQALAPSARPLPSDFLKV